MEGDPNSAEASVLIPDFYAFHRTGQYGIQFLGKTVASNGDLSVLRAELVVGIFKSLVAVTEHGDRV